MDEYTSPSKTVVERVVDIIGQSELPVGGHLPSERQLAAMLGETRGQVRKAIDTLRHDGMVEVIPQVGAILKSRNPCTTTFQKVLSMDSIDIQSLIELRVSLEVTAAGLAAKRATDEDIRSIADACDEYEREASAYSPWHEQNIRFHMTIVRASQNGAIIAIMENVLNDAVIYTRSRQSFYTQERLNRSIREHQAIVAAIRNRDEELAVKTMRLHMRKMSDMADNLSKIMQ